MTLKEMIDELNKVITAKSTRYNGQKSIGFMRKESYKDVRYCRDMKIYNVIPAGLRDDVEYLVFNSCIHKYGITPVLEEFEKEYKVNVGFCGRMAGQLELDLEINPEYILDDIGCENIGEITYDEIANCDRCNGCTKCYDEIKNTYKIVKEFDKMADEIIEYTIDCAKCRQEKKELEKEEEELCEVS